MSRRELLHIIDELYLKLESMKVEVQQTTMDRTHLSIENRQLKLKMIKLQNQVDHFLKAEKTGRFFMAPNASGKAYYPEQWICNPGLLSYNLQPLEAREIVHHPKLSLIANIPNKAIVKTEQAQSDNRYIPQHMAAINTQSQGKLQAVKQHLQNIQPPNPKLPRLEILNDNIPYNPHSGFTRRSPLAVDNNSLQQKKHLTEHSRLKVPPVAESIQTVFGFSKKRKINGLKYSACTVDLNQVDDSNREHNKKKRKRGGKVSCKIEKVFLGERRKTWIFCLHCYHSFHLLPLKDRNTRSYRTRAMFRHRCKNGKRLRLNVVKRSDHCMEKHTGPCIRLVPDKEVNMLQSQKLRNAIFCKKFLGVTK